MKHSVPFITLLLLLLLPAARAFTFNTLNVPNPVLERFTQDFTVKKPSDVGTLLDVKLDVGQNDHHMNLNGMLIELLPDAISKQQAKTFPGLPGANGPNPKISTGTKHLNIQQTPSFIDMTGKQSIALKDGCWEIVWRDGALSGSLICGFHSADSYQRNDATLPKG